MIFPCGLPDRGKKKNEKKFAITKIVLIFALLFDFRAVLHCFGCPFQNEKIGCLNVLSLALTFKHKEI